MQQLIQTAKRVLQQRDELPFSVYSSVKDQHIVNVPIIKPVLFCVLDGCKKLGRQGEVSCPSGNFIFLSNNPNINMRNISSDKAYFALQIEFDYADFDHLTRQTFKTELYFQGQIDAILATAFVAVYRVVSVCAFSHLASSTSRVASVVIPFGL